MRLKSGDTKIPLGGGTEQTLVKFRDSHISWRLGEVVELWTVKNPEVKMPLWFSIGDRRDKK